MTALDWHGMVEGFYGDPWTFDQRTAFFSFAAETGLNAYVYAPKFDPYHRDRWNEPYPPQQLAELAELNSRAAAAGVRFVYAISPALTMRFADDADHRALAAKCEQLWQVGIRSFSLLFDDVPTELPHPEDRERFGHDAAATGRAHGHAAARFAAGFLAEHGIDEPLLVCPTDYAGTQASPYRDGLADQLPAEARILWTGSDIVVGAISRADIDSAAASYGRDLVLWDNFPVNDFDRSRLFLGPLTGRPGDVEGSRLTGILSNPMVEAAPSRYALAAVGEWAEDPAGYDPATAAEHAFERVSPDAPALRALVAACSAWPPSAAPWPELADALPLAIAGDEAALTLVESRMRALAATDATGAPADLAAALEPWVLAARASGAAGGLACRVLRSGAGSPETLLEARRGVEAHFANVARGPALALLDAGLGRLGVAAADTGASPHRASAGLVLVLTGPNPSPGDRELAETLSAAGYAVELRAHVPGAVELGGAVLGTAVLVIVARAADPAAVDAVAAAPVPLLAWGHLVELGLASASEQLLSIDTIDVVADHPAAAGLRGAVAVYRGPSRATWGDTGPDATVIARDTEGGHPVLALYEAGAMLVDGSVAPAARATAFFGPDGFAPWLVTAETRALVLALVARLAAATSRTTPEL